MDEATTPSSVRRIVSALAKLAVGVALFALVAPATASSAPVPDVCRSAHAISV